MFLTLEEFLAHFPTIKMTKDDFSKSFKVMYSNPQSLDDLFNMVIPPNREGSKRKLTSLIKNTDDRRWINRQKIIDYFYEIIILNRHRYLTYFYESYFTFKDPATLNWDDKADIMSYPESFSPHGVISLQKNDASRRLIRNLFYLELLDKTRVTNTVKSHVSFWTSLTNMYNKLELEDRFFANSSIDLFLKDKGTENERKPSTGNINYNNLFYLFQAYQGKASIFNPYSIGWILKNVIDKERGSPGKSLFTPVLSWGSYLPAIMHNPTYNEYLGVDVMPTVCKKVEFLSNWYNKADKKVTIKCCPSESLLHNKQFLMEYKDHFDTVLLCPPYFDMEVYHEGEQSINSYPDYEEWLQKYWRQTVHMCSLVMKPGGIFAMIVNDYNTLSGEVRLICKDLDEICRDYFKPTGEEFYYLQNRTSPLRVNAKDRTERLFIYKKL